MSKLIFTAFFDAEEAIKWQLCSGESLQERLLEMTLNEVAADEMALNEVATDDNAASLTAKVFSGHGMFAVEVRMERNPVLDCICGECAEADHYFKCEGCGHDTPWCRGADDQYPDLCDDCAVKEAHERDSQS